jgi:Ca2+-binding RTX toxin-like protein
MIGDDGNNFFFGLFGGKDTVELGGGSDFVDAGAGADVLSGGPGTTDELGMVDGRNHRPRRGGVTVDLSTNTDSDHDTLSGFEDVSGSLANDTLTGDDGPNLMFGNDGNDAINGLAGDDHLVGARGGHDRRRGRQRQVPQRRARLQLRGRDISFACLRPRRASRRAALGRQSPCPSLPRASRVRSARSRSASR